MSYNNHVNDIIHEINKLSSEDYEWLFSFLCHDWTNRHPSITINFNTKIENIGFEEHQRQMLQFVTTCIANTDHYINNRCSSCEARIYCPIYKEKWGL